MLREAGPVAWLERYGVWALAVTPRCSQHFKIGARTAHPLVSA
jgi:hypothetical protein